MRNLFILTALVSLFLAACKPDEKSLRGESANPSPQGGLSAGIERDNFDPAVKPGDDFYRYVNGAWLARSEIPADRSSYGVFTILSDRAEENLRQIIDEAVAAEGEAGSEAQKVGDFFSSFMAVETVENRGVSPLREKMKEIVQAPDKKALMGLIADLSTLGVQTPLGIFIDNDARQSDQYITYLNQSGLGLPDRDWYLSEDNDTHAEARDAYRAYVGRLLSLADYPAAERAPSTVMQIETRLAEGHWDRVQNRQRELTYNKLTLDELAGLAPAIPWSDFFRIQGVRESNFIVRQPSFLEAFNSLWDEVDVDQWRDYASFKLVDAYASYLSDDFVTAEFDFKGRVLNGLEEMRPRWKRAVDTVDEALGEVLGKLYVERYFQAQAKQRMDALVKNLREAFREGIDDLAWMTPVTKTQAQEKLTKFTAKIGYPDQWKDYQALEVKADDLAGNVMRAMKVMHDREVNKLGGPIDRGEWFMTPHTVNAYYNPPMNEVVFPAAILQPPFFNVEADDAVNYGAIGAVIGHEISHGFDDQGRKSDGDGNLRDWWTETDAQAFKQRAASLVDQYGELEVLPGKYLNGEFTLGENIGDLSGLAVAFRAYRMSLEGKEAPVIDGLSGDQRFFLGWAQVWRRLYRDENLEMRLTNDPHSHSEARVNGVVRNFDAWYEAFGVKPGDGLYLAPQERVQIW